MVVSDASIHNIMGGMESTGGVRLHNHRRKLKQRFDIIKKLGQGTYGKVQLGINKETGQEVAIKTIKKAKIETEADLVRIRREIQIMSSVQHPNIIHIYEVFENREKMVLVMEYAAGGELYDYLSERKVLSEDEARRIFRQISTAVYYCHKHKICHRDLKLENILLDEHGSAKIADFGLSNVFDEQRLLNTFCGSPLYASPEIVKGTPYHGPEVDCWSLGVLLYTLVYGAMPFDGSNFKRLVRQISQGDYFEPKKPSPASPLIREMLTVTPGRRADIEKICSHWWVNEGYGESCLEIAEELANQTPVRLDLLLSLAPPAPNVGSDKLLVGAEQDGGAAVMGNDVLSSVPARCHSVGSLMELDHRPSDVSVEDVTGKDTAKRKLEGGISTEEANRGASKRKERSRRSTRERSSERHRGRSSSRSKQKSDSVSTEEPMEVDSGVVDVDRSLQGSVETIVGSVKTATSSVDTIAGSSVQLDEGLETLTSGTPKNRTATDLVKDLEGSETLLPENECSAVAQDSVQVPNDEGESAKIKVKRKKKVVSDSKGVAEDSGSQVTDQVNSDSASVVDSTKVPTVCDTMNNGSAVAPEAAVQNSMVGDHINAEVSETASSVGELDVNGVSVNSTSAAVSSPVDIPKKVGTKTRRSKGELSLGKLGSGSEKSSGANTPEDTASPPSKPVERRRSKIFETAEKFNMLAGAEPKSPTSEKPKKVFIPGVKVSDAKRAFERKSSSAVSVPSLAKSPSSKKTEEPKTEISDIENYESTAEENKALSNDKDAQQTTKAMNGVEEIVAVPNETNAVINETSKKLSDLELNDQPAPRLDDSPAVLQKEDSLKFIPPLKTSEKPNKQEEARIKKLKDAVEIISNAITEGHRKEAGVDNTKKGTATKPPVPVPQELKTKTKTINITTPLSPKSPPLSPVDLQTGKKLVRVQVAPNDFRFAVVQVASPVENKSNFNTVNELKDNQNDNNVISEVSERRTDQEPDSNDYAPGINTDAANRKKSSKVEITLKSATLPRRKTSKAEIRLNSPSVAPAGFHTEVSHRIEPAELTTQRSEAAFPVSAAAPKQPPRSVSLEPEGKASKPRERIIPICVEEGSSVRPPVAPTQQRPYTSQRSGSLSRQSTQDSDTDSTVSVGPEPIRKSPREYIIPIAVEGGGYVTPRAGSLEPSVSDENNSKPRQRKTSRFGRHRRMSGLLSDASEDEGFNSPFATLQRHSSLSRDKEPETPEEERGAFHMHRLRSSRPNRSTLERNDSISSAEDDDDDDGFEILTAESLFSTLLSRVRSLTQRLNVEDGARPGFPTSTLMSQLKNVGRTPPSRFWSSMGEPLSRRLSETSHFSRPFSRDQDIPWRRSASRDMSDSGSVYSDNSGTVPRGAAQPGSGIADADLGAAESSSSAAPKSPTPSPSPSSSSMPQYTPSLSRRILPDAGRRLSRTSSMREERPQAPASRWSSQVDASLPPAPRRSGSGSSCGSLPPLPFTRRRTLVPPVSYRPRERVSVAGIDDTLERIRAERSAAGLGLGASALPSAVGGSGSGSGSGSAVGLGTSAVGAGDSFAERYRPSHIPALSRFPRRSASFTHDYDYGRRSFDTAARGDAQEHARRETSSASSPDRSVLGKFLQRDSHQPASSAPEARKTTGVTPETAEGAEAAAKKKTRKISRFLRPDFFDTPREESVYAKEKEAQKSAEAEAKKAKRLARRAALLEKKQAEILKEAKTEIKTPDGPAADQTPSDASAPESSEVANGKPESTKNRFLHSLEKKLEKFRSSGGDATVPSRVEQAINSLRKQSTTTDVPSESALLKRAVSVDDVRLPPSARPVSSVLGLLRRMESSPGRRTQSVYAGATSDTVLDCVAGEKLKPDKKRKEVDMTASLGSAKPSTDETLPAISGDTKTKRDAKKQVTKDSKKDIISDQTSPDGKRQIEVKTTFGDQRDIKKERLDDKNPNTEEKSVTKNATTTSGKSTSKTSPTLASSTLLGAAKSDESSKTCNVQTPSAGTRSTGANRQSAVSNAPLSAKEENISKTKNRNLKNIDAVTRPEAETTTMEQTSFTKRPADQKAQSNKLNETVRPVLRDEIYSCANHVSGSPAIAPRPSKVSSNAIAAGNIATLEPLKHHLEQGESILNDGSAISNRRDIGKLALNLPKIELQGTNHCSHLSPFGQDDYASTLSPADESESIDSWSVCSDLDSRDFSLSSYPKTPSPVMEDETVEERIRRKSFYTRFNDIRRKNHHRKSSSGHLLGLKESVSRKSSFSDAPSLAARPKKATRSQSLYNPSEIEAFNESKGTTYGSGSVMEGVTNTNAATSSAHTNTGTLQNGCGKKESDPAVVVNCDHDPKFHASSQGSVSRESGKACPEINGQKEDSIEILTDNHRIPTVSRSKLPTLDRMKKGEVAGAKFTSN